MTSPMTTIDFFRLIKTSADVIDNVNASDLKPQLQLVALLALDRAAYFGIDCRTHSHQCEPSDERL